MSSLEAHQNSALGSRDSHGMGRMRECFFMYSLTSLMSSKGFLHEDVFLLISEA